MLLDLARALEPLVLEHEHALALRDGDVALDHRSAGDPVQRTRRDRVERRLGVAERAVRELEDRMERAIHPRRRPRASTDATASANGS